MAKVFLPRSLLNKTRTSFHNGLIVNSFIIIERKGERENKNIGSNAFSGGLLMLWTLIPEVQASPIQHVSI